MKKLNLIIALMSSAMLVNAQMIFSNSEELLMINPLKSKIKWIGEYAFYFGGHDGTIAFEKGYFIKKNKVITGGEFIIDMKSIKNTDIKKADANASLVEHLKNEDFFDVEKFPKSKLVITSVTYHDQIHMEIHAMLTIKDITLPINFQAEANYAKKELTTRFKIDRTLWGITYNSKEIEGKLKDGLISDAIGFEVILSL